MKSRALASRAVPVPQPHRPGKPENIQDDGGSRGIPGPGVLLPWPYPLRIHTLGRFQVTLDGQVSRFSGKAQRRPLLILHALLARGGRPVPVSHLRKLLGEAEGLDDAPCSRGAFDMALSRLRHLLPVPGLLCLGDDALSLDEDRVWVDAWALDRRLGRVAGPGTPARRLALLGRALDLYEGEFLPGNDSAPVLLARERLHARLLRVARHLGEDFEARGDWSGAGGLYERLREHYPLDENLCLHLLRSHLRRDQQAQARGLYDRCRALMARVLGVLPGLEIRRLMESLS